MSREDGQATVEWIGLVLLVALGLGALLTFGPRVDGRSYGGFLARAIVCAVRGGCDDGRGALAAAYGERDAELVRRFAPNLVYEPGEKEIPTDFRHCRTTRCGNAPTDRSLDVSRTDAGVPATVFTHVIHAGSSTFIQYWFYYPDSDSYFPGSHVGWKVLNVANLIWGSHRPLGRYPGFHHDDWEGSIIHFDANQNFGQAGGSRSARQTSTIGSGSAAITRESGGQRARSACAACPRGCREKPALVGGVRAVSAAAPRSLLGGRARGAVLGSFQAPAAAVWWLWSLSRLWVAVMSRHSDRTADLPRRWNLSILRLCLVWPKTGSIMPWRFR